MKRQFIAVIDRDVTGELGWKDVRIAYGDPSYQSLSYGIGLAHDALEHFSFDGVAGEIMAHGAMYWIRYQGGYVDSNGRNLDLDSIASEWIQLYHLLEQDSSMPFAKRTTKLESEIEEDITSIINNGCSLLRSEFTDSLNSGYIHILRKHFRAWFRCGFRTAARQYGRMDMRPHDVSYLYLRLGKELQKNLPEYAGQELEIVIKNKDFSLSLRDSEDMMMA